MKLLNGSRSGALCSLAVGRLLRTKDDPWFYNVKGEEEEAVGRQSSVVSRLGQRVTVCQRAAGWHSR